MVTEEMSQFLYPDEFRSVSRLIGEGKYREAFEGLSVINQKYDLHQIGVLINVAGFLIDIGDGLNDPAIVRKGIGFLESNKERIFTQGKELEFTYWYDLGNGFAALHKIEKQEPDFKYSIVSINQIQQAKNCFYHATTLLTEKGPQIDNERMARLYVNLGNCFNDLGRNLESIEFYDKALYHSPKHPMALANKARVFCFLTHVTPEKEYYSKLYYEAYWMLKSACKSKMIEEAPRRFFEDSYLKPIKKSLTGKMNLRKKTEHVRVWHRRYRSRFKTFYVNFCLNHRLYLNPHSFYCNCYASVGDPIVIQKMLVPSKGKDKYLSLCRYLNQVKQEFATARFLLTQSQFKDPKLRFVDGKVAIINTLDYASMNVYQELLKFSYRLAFSSLDKIAVFLNEYLELNQKGKIYFANIWYANLEFKKGINNKLNEIQANVGLVALYDIAQDYSKQGNLSHLSIIRNHLEHKYLQVVPLGPISSPFSDEDEETNIHELAITEDKLLEVTLNLFQAVRSAIIYLVNLVWIEETKKERILGEEKVIPLFARNIPDELKYY